MPIGMTVAELVAQGMSHEQAEHEMRKRVFGADYRTDKNGRPIEQGHGSLAQPTEPHFAALEKFEGADAAAAARAKAGSKRA